MPATMIVPSFGDTRLNVSDTERSARPSRTSLTASISAPCTQKVPTRLISPARIAPTQPSTAVRRIEARATTTKTTKAMEKKWRQCAL